MSLYSTVVRTRETAHEAVRTAYAHARCLIDEGKPVRIEAGEVEDDRSLQQNRFYWGVVLHEISAQAKIGGQRWAVVAWHELFKRQFLGFEIKKTAVAGRKRKVVTRKLRSTAGLKVKAFGAYLEEVQAFAATDLGVEFSVSRWQDYQP